MGERCNAEESGFLQGAWPFGVVELVWTVVVGWRWGKEYSALRG